MSTYVERLARYDRVSSRAASWCQWLAIFSVPYLIIVILGHRFGAVDTISTFWLLAVGVLILVAALIAGGRGFYELWNFGHEAGLNSARGMALAAVLLCPFLYQGARAFALPPLYDISTDLEDPPSFDTVLDDRTDAMNPILDPTRSTRRLQLQAYPRVAARRYPLDAARVFREIVGLISDRDWTILTANTQQGEAPIDEEGSGFVAKPVSDSKGRPLRIPVPKDRPDEAPGTAGSDDGSAADFETVQVSPIGRTGAEENEDQEERYIEAVATSFLFGFESDVAIRMVEEEDGTLVDMRSASRFGPHDLGGNAQRIISFMNDLDTALQGLGQGG